MADLWDIPAFLADDHRECDRPGAADPVADHEVEVWEVSLEVDEWDAGPLRFGLTLPEENVKILWFACTATPRQGHPDCEALTRFHSSSGECKRTEILEGTPNRRQGVCDGGELLTPQRAQRSAHGGLRRLYVRGDPRWW